MSAEIARELQQQQRTTPRTRTRALRARVVLALGPATMLAGLAWALVQPYRLTLLHPHDQGFWWLFSEPPLYVVLAGLVFWRVVAVPLAQDLERRR
jgi:hypothetical protein